MKPKFFLIGFLLVILIAVPLTVYILTQQGPTNTKSSAAKATILSIPSPAPTGTVGQSLDIPIEINTANQGSTNQVSLVKFAITYDSSILQAASNFFTPDPAFQVALEGPNNSCSNTTPTPSPASTTCTISATVSIPADPTKAVSGNGTVGVLHFTPLTTTDANGTKISFVPNQQQVLSLASSDTASENVLLSAQDGTIVISSSDTGGGASPTDTPTPTPGSSGGGGGGGGGGGSSGGGSSGGGSGSTGSTGPACSSLTADKASSDTAPFTVLLTANGSATASISKVSFNFGDGDVSDVTSGGGIGTTSVNAQISHVYKTTGTFTATATVTDANGSTSTPNSCSQVISIGQGTSPTPTPAAVTPITSVAPTGPGDTFVAAGIAGAILVIAGLAILVF